MYRFKSVVVGVCGLLLLFWGVPCVGAAEKTIKIGCLMPLTGFAASDGVAVQESLALAVKQVNAAGGVLGKKIELVYYDDAADSKQAVSLAHKLIGQDKIRAFIAGSYSLPTRAVAPLFDDAEIPLVAAYAIHPDITQGDYTFRNGFMGVVEGRAAADVVVNTLKAKKIAIITSDNDFGKTLSEGFSDYLKKNKKENLVALRLTYPMSEKDYKVYLSKIKESGADTVFFSGYFFQTGPALKQAAEMGLKCRFVGEQGSDSPKTAEIGGKAAEGFIIMTNLDRDDSRPVVKKYLKDYRAAYKIEPNMVGAGAYDCFMLIVDAIKRAKSDDPQAIRDALAKTKNYDGLTGVIQGFDKRGEVIKPVQVQIIRNGVFRHFGVVKDPKLITP